MKDPSLTLKEAFDWLKEHPKGKGPIGIMISTKDLKRIRMKLKRAKKAIDQALEVYGDD